MLPQSEFDSSMYATGTAPVAIAAITQDRALIGLLRSTVDPANDLILVTSEAELVPHLNSRRVSAALLDSMFIEGDLAGMAERLRATWPDLVLVVVGTAEEQSKVAAQITSGVVYRFLHRPVSAPRVRLFVDAALRRHEVENVERTLEQVRPDFSRMEGAAPASAGPASPGTPSALRAVLPGILGAATLIGLAVWFLSSSDSPPAGSPAAVASPSTDEVARREARDSANTPPASVQSTAPEATAEPSASPANATAPAAAPSVTTRQSPPDVVRPKATPGPSATPEEPSAPVGARSSLVRVPDESTLQTPPPSQALTHAQRLRNLLDQAEAALQRGELASPPGRNAVALFTGALELDPGNTLAKGGLVRVADRLLSAAERALTAGNVEDARNMVAVAESLTPATSRGAFLMMQIERERERASLARARDRGPADPPDKAATYLRLANARLRSGNLIAPSGDNARFYLEAARELRPDDAGLQEATRTLQKSLLDRAADAARVGDAPETERWLANADGAGAPRPELTAIRRSLQDTLISARAERMSTLARSFNAALSAGRLLPPGDDNARTHLLALIDTDATSPTVVSARQSLGGAYLSAARTALTRDELDKADAWLDAAHSIGFSAPELGELEKQLVDARTRVAERSPVVGANSLRRIEYVAPKYPPIPRMGPSNGWVELEFTVRADGSTADIVVTNSSPRRTFDRAAMEAVSQWRYEPVVRDGKPAEQRAAVRIRFAGD